MNCVDKIAKKYIELSREQFQQITDDMNKPTSKEDLEYWRKAIEVGRKINVRHK